jgi:hypothetical protein
MKSWLRFAAIYSVLFVAFPASAGTLADTLTSAAGCEPKSPNTWLNCFPSNGGGGGEGFEGHSVTPLAFGVTLIAGGYTIDIRAGEPGQILQSTRALDFAYTYQEPVGLQQTVGRIHWARYNHTATRLADGKVLIVGGAGDQGPLTASEIYHPLTQSFSVGPTMNRAHAGHTATVLKSGGVLVAGGAACRVSPCDTTTAAEIFDRSLNRFVPTGSMNLARTRHAAVLLPDGRVFVAGGRADASTEIYDPATGRFTLAAPMSVARPEAAATLLPDGRVVVAGGDLFETYSFEIYSPGTNSFAPPRSLGWSPAGAVIPGHLPRVAGLIAAMTSTGKVVFASDFTAQTYDPATGILSPAVRAFGLPGEPDYEATRGGQGALLKTDLLLWSGGTESSSFYTSTTGRLEMYRPAD